MTATIVQGNAVRSRCTFRDVDNDLMDPSPVVCMVQTPDGTETSYVYGVDAEITRASLGIYDFWVPTNAASGTYTPRWKGTDADGNVVANEAAFEVDASVFTTP